MYRTYKIILADFHKYNVFENSENFFDTKINCDKTLFKYFHWIDILFEHNSIRCHVG